MLLRVLCVVVLAVPQCAFHLTIYHTNDIHARFDERGATEGAKCDKGKEGMGCYGGMPRHETFLKENRRDNTLLLSGGDWFTGTTYFNVYNGNLTAHYLDTLGYDVMVLGNHEFDKGSAILGAALQQLEKTKVVTANIDVTEEPALKDIVTKYTLVDVDKDGTDDIGIIGYLVKETEYLSNPGDNVKFSDEVAAVREQAAVLKKMGINKIIALGHAGIEIDERICEEVEDVDIVVGGHTNTFLWNGPQPSVEEIEGPYPKVFEKNNHKCLVVQAFAYGKYMGNITATFDDAGEITEYAGNPLLMDRSIEEDADMLAELETFSKKKNEFSKIIVGKANRDIDGSRIHCRQKECELGNILTDAFLNNYRIQKSDGTVRCALVNGGSIRSYIPGGDITLDDIMTVMPFGNTVNRFTATGAILRAAFEHGVSAFNSTTGNNSEGRYLQVAGIRVLYNVSRPVGSRVVDLKIEVPVDWSNNRVFEEVADEKQYNCVAPNYLLAGGDNFSMLKNLDSSPDAPDMDLEVFKRFVAENSPLDEYAGIQDIPARSFFSGTQRGQHLQHLLHIYIAWALFS